MQKVPDFVMHPAKALGHQILGEVEPGPDEPQASAIDGRMYQAQGPR